MDEKNILLSNCKKLNFSQSTIKKIKKYLQDENYEELKKTIPFDIFINFMETQELLKNISMDTQIFRNDQDFIIKKDVPPEIFIDEFKQISLVKDYDNDMTNFLTNNSILNMDEKDTVESKMDLIFLLLETNSVIVIQGNTGCGKTTKIPRYLLTKYKSIVCTQPRRIAAISVAKKVAGDMKENLGKTVGYTVRFDDCTSKNTRLKYVTDGIMLKEIGSDNFLKKYDCIIIDEAHERTLNIDLLLGFCKMMVMKKTKIKIILMSATISTKEFVDFFECPFVEINYKIFPLQNYFIKKYNPDDWFHETIRTVIQLHTEQKKGDILVFLTGQEDIKEAYEILSQNISSSDCKLLMMYSTMSLDDQEEVFQKYPIRKIILSTNICETSVTIENIVYVVDCGRVKQMRHSSNLGMYILETVMISKAQAKQRSGRAGRTAPGQVFKIYTKEEYDQMLYQTPPEILTTNISSAILTIKSLGVNDIISYQFLDSPSILAVNSALEYLFLIKAIDSHGNITDLGRKISSIPLDPSLALALVKSMTLGCFDDVAIISAMLTVELIFLDIKRENKIYKKFVKIKSSWNDDRGDFYVFLGIYKAWERTNFAFRFLKENFLNIRNMFQAKKVKEQLDKMFNMKKFSNVSKVIEAFCAGYFMNIAKITHDGYTTIFQETECFMHSSSCLYKKNVKYVLYYTIIRTKKEYIKYCNVVTPEILCRSVNHVFNHKIKRDIH